MLDYFYSLKTTFSKII